MTAKTNEARIAELQAELKALRKAEGKAKRAVKAAEKRNTIRCKVNKKGAVAVYGIKGGRATLTTDQWCFLLNTRARDIVMAFVNQADADRLAKAA